MVCNTIHFLKPHTIALLYYIVLSYLLNFLRQLFGTNFCDKIFLGQIFSDVYEFQKTPKQSNPSLDKSSVVIRIGF